MIVLHFLLGVASYMGREWELSYRLGLQRYLNNRICFEMSSNASPEDSLDRQIQNFRESGELSRKGNKNFSLPESETFKNIIKKRKKTGMFTFIS